MNKLFIFAGFIVLFILVAAGLATWNRVTVYEHCIKKIDEISSGYKRSIPPIVAETYEMLKDQKYVDIASIWVSAIAAVSTVGMIVYQNKGESKEESN